MAKKMLTADDCQCHTCKLNEAFPAGSSCKIQFCSVRLCESCRLAMIRCTDYERRIEK